MSEAEIEQLIEQYDLKGSNEAFVLMDPKRRRVYDRNHKVLESIGELRVNLGLVENGFGEFEARNGFAPAHPTRARYLDAAGRLVVKKQSNTRFWRVILDVGTLLVVVGFLAAAWYLWDKDRVSTSWTVPTTGLTYRVVLTDRGAKEPYKILEIHPGETLETTISEGEYDIKLGWGVAWSDIKKFGDGSDAAYYELPTMRFNHGENLRIDLQNSMKRVKQWTPISRDAF